MSQMSLSMSQMFETIILSINDFSLINELNINEFNCFMCLCKLSVQSSN